MTAAIRNALIGFGFAILLTGYGAAISGGGHWTLPLALALAPIPFGFLVWPAAWCLLDKLAAERWKVAFASVLFAHYLGLAFFLSREIESDLYWFRIGARQEGYVFVALVVPVLLWLSGQVFLWFRFFRCIRVSQSKKRNDSAQ
ncbi:MAG TPA: hypothetical protein VGP79_06370 [Bryobacteraceae bacterium]|jgi:hypothetical protein|nr:hypothetical protein [Bryobacteraceae bacterium]